MHLKIDCTAVMAIDSDITMLFDELAETIVQRGGTLELVAPAQPALSQS